MLAQPTDGWNEMERLFLKDMIIQMYQSIVDPLDRFIIIASAESGYSQGEISEMCQISQEAISRRMRKIRIELKSRYGKVTLSREVIIKPNKR